ncbi:MAG: phosphate signaling complex protein PhoU [Clostridia bacterium]|nr:phosphate signaling complex protein PhoU [Clostridia bacterium]
MRNRFDSQLENLNNSLIEMGGLVEQAISNAYSALISQDAKQAEKNIKFDVVINEKEREIEGLCMKLLLQQQPVAKDLRLISAVLKMITDLERIGDHAQDISEIVLFLSSQQYIKKLEHISRMAQITAKMVTDSIDAFVKRDIMLAQRVCDTDDTVDDLFVTVKNELISLINENVKNGEQAMDFLMVAKYFERIGDHAVNVGEWVIFSITGKHKEFD